MCRSEAFDAVLRIRLGDDSFARGKSLCLTDCVNEKYVTKSTRKYHRYQVRPYDAVDELSQFLTCELVPGDRGFIVALTARP